MYIYIYQHFHLTEIKEDTGEKEGRLHKEEKF